ncbi:MAG: hypothetical protein VXW79_02490, partial [Bacteroidota bacterium]|nr:hypothetical protein [Bacteroidota bacterium]
MANRTVLVLLAALALIPMAHGQTTVDDLINEVYGGGVRRPSGYTFSHVIHYDLVQRIEAGEGRPPRRIEGNMDLYFTPGDSAYARVVETGETTLISIGDLTRGMRYTPTDLGVPKLGTEATMSDRMTDTLQVMRVSGDREIDGRMSAHYWFEEGTRIDELWADSQSNDMENAIGRLWPRFEPGFQSLATGTYEGFATRWISIDTRFSRDPRLVLEFKGIEAL